MRNFILSKKERFEVTGNKAHKILETLKKYDFSEIIPEFYRGGSYSKKFNTFDINYASLLTSTVEDIVKDVENEIEKNISDHTKVIEIYEDMMDIKEAVFEFNIREGISKKINYINKKKYHIQLLDSCLSKTKNKDESLFDIVSRFKKLDHGVFESNEGFSFSYNYWDNDVISQKLKEIRATISQYEDEIAATNALKKLTIELSESSREILGM
ncbi:MAG: hypothetical protein RBQ81_05055 [Arcobacteraceae bacterium]|jgi:hypothetical protein|nr:hypothetical protein [Arcobacteraceae bacterium]MDY0365210.1 hypothetical protein [Arcobacteraceae bacterium]